MKHKRARRLGLRDHVRAELAACLADYGNPDEPAYFSPDYMVPWLEARIAALDAGASVLVYGWQLPAGAADDHGVYRLAADETLEPFRVAEGRPTR